MTIIQAQNFIQKWESTELNENSCFNVYVFDVRDSST